MVEWSGYLSLFAVGLVAGTLNVVAGGGSFLTLPMLIFLGLPPSVANATNRVGVVLQNVGAVWSFSRHRLMRPNDLYWAALPATAGAFLGTWAALRVSDADFRRILAFLMLAVTLWTLLSPRSGASPGINTDFPGRRGLLVALLFFLAGIYGGFVQAGVGFFILAITSLSGLDLVRGNAVKVLAVLCFTCVSLAIFAWQGRVEWWAGAAMALGMVLGGLVGVRLTVIKGHRWVKWVVTSAIVVFALRLWWSG